MRGRRSGIRDRKNENGVKIQISVVLCQEEGVAGNT